MCDDKAKIFDTDSCSSEKFVNQTKMFFGISGRPDQVHNCTITNISMTSLGIKCLEGFNGGLTQSFMLEVRDMSTQVIEVDFNAH